MERVVRIRNKRQAAITKESSFCFIANAIINPSMIKILWN